MNRLGATVDGRVVFGLKVPLTQITEAVAEQKYGQNRPVHLAGIGWKAKGGDLVESQQRQDDEQDEASDDHLQGNSEAEMG